MTNQELVSQPPTIPTLFQFVAGLLPSTSHCAMADVKATGTIFRFPISFETRTECVFKFSEREEEVRAHKATLTTTDSDSDSESGNSQCGESIFSSSSSSDDEDSNIVPLGDTWDQGCDFKPTEPNPSIDGLQTIPPLLLHKTDNSRLDFNAVKYMSTHLSGPGEKCSRLPY
jgi:hypothetical protein